MPVDRCMKETTHRQYLYWMDWLERQYNHPSLTDFYLMQLNMDVRRGIVKYPNRVKFEDFKLKFDDPIPVVTEKAEPTQEEIKKVSQAALSRWLAVVGPPETMTEVAAVSPED